MHFFREHVTHHLVILSMLLLGFSLLTFFEARNAQLFSVIAIAVFYPLYGILHHRLVHDLTVKIVVEYVIISLLVISLFILVKGGM